MLEKIGKMKLVSRMASITNSKWHKVLYETATIVVALGLLIFECVPIAHDIWGQEMAEWMWTAPLIAIQILTVLAIWGLFVNFINCCYKAASK